MLDKTSPRGTAWTMQEGIMTSLLWCEFGVEAEYCWSSSPQQRACRHAPFYDRENGVSEGTSK